MREVLSLGFRLKDFIGMHVYNNDPSGLKFWKRAYSYMYIQSSRGFIRAGVSRVSRDYYFEFYSVLQLVLKVFKRDYNLKPTAKKVYPVEAMAQRGQSIIPIERVS